MTTTTETAPVAIGRCSDCKAMVSAHHYMAECQCGNTVYLSWVIGKVSKRKCSGICTHAQGPSCSCECGGANHGRGWL